MGKYTRKRGFIVKSEKRDLEKKYSDYYDNYDLYMMKYILPEIYSHQFYSYYYRGLIGNESLEQYVGSIGEIFNLKFDFDSIRKEVEEILRIKYNLEIVKDNPLTIKCLR